MRTFVVCDEWLEGLADNVFPVKFSRTRAQYGKHGSKHDGKHGRSSWALNKSLQRDGDESPRRSTLVNVCTVMQDAVFVKLPSREKFSPRNCHAKRAMHVIRTKYETSADYSWLFHSALPRHQRECIALFKLVRVSAADFTKRVLICLISR